MKKIFDVISETPLFRGLPENQLKEIELITVLKHFNKGETIFIEGEEGIGFFIVVDGRVKVYKVSSEGKEHILHIFGPSEPFGEVPVFTGQPFPANAEAITESHVLFFSRTDFVALISRNPSLSLNMLAVLSKRLRHFTIQIENLSLKEVPARLASYLLYTTAEQGKGDVVILAISKGQLASLLGTIPETLSRIFGKMANQNLIRVDGRNIHLVDLAGLKELAEFGKYVA